MQLFYTPRVVSDQTPTPNLNATRCDLRSDVITNAFFQTAPTTVVTFTTPFASADGVQKDIQLTSYDRELLTTDDEVILLDLLSNPAPVTSTLQPFGFTASSMGSTTLELKTAPSTMFYPSTKPFAEQSLLQETIAVGK